MYNETEAALQQALFAILCNAKKMGVDIETLCKTTNDNLLDAGNDCRYVSSPELAMKAKDYINEELKRILE